MNILGISAGFHDAAASVVSDQGEILFAAHSERYSKYKHDAAISAFLTSELARTFDVDTLAYYERPWRKQWRQWYAGQGIQWHKLTARQILRQQLGKNFINGKRIKSHGHHASHAAAGFQTSPFDRATVVVIDAIGEWDTVSIWGAEYNDRGHATYTPLWQQRYPHSIGLFYSAVTRRVGLHPLDEEYITMGMAGWGRNLYQEQIEHAEIADVNHVLFKNNLHAGIADNWLAGASAEDIAASAQAVTERLINAVMYRAAEFNWSSNLVYMGGVALNCLANRNLGRHFNRFWIMPAPGDAGSSLGAAALTVKKRLSWRSAYLGHNISGDYPVQALLAELESQKIVGVASGRAEFGPRALGNRSLLADPRGTDIKDRVNEIKRRQRFRPFAPVILEEHVNDYFDMPRGWTTSRYMQVVARCRRPNLYPAIVHVDDTSRVQTVPANGSGIRRLLEAWYNRTQCPMLLNTSLNIRGEPMVNDRFDADRFELLYGVKVCS